MMSNLKYYLDRQPIHSLPDTLRKIVTDRNLLTNNGASVSFCGLLLDGDEVAVFFPRTVSLSSVNDKQVLARELLFALQKYVVSNKSSVLDYEQPNLKKSLQSLSLYMWLLNDYLNNGLYVKKTQLKTKNTSNVDWNRTMKSEVPHLSDGVPIYFVTHGRKSTFSQCQIITNIHANIIKQVFSRFGWLMPYSESLKADINLRVKSSIDNQQQGIALLRKELQDVYTDRDIRLLHKLIEYLNEDLYGEFGSYAIGVQYFEHVWEHMLFRVSAQKVDVNNLFPRPKYIDHNDKPEIAPQRSLRTDIVIKDDKTKTIYILDAKYYQATQVSNLPGWQDMLKQFYYDDLLSQHYPSYRLKSFFLFPGNHAKYKQISISEPLKTRIIHCAYFDPMNIIRKFNHDKTIVLQSELSQTSTNL